ncbi:oligosaccharide flippase family protein [Arcobacter lacus]|uniref:lipopolysaccharide biosynthesis protein n=1 Tax=Arcobacter lacus TaxID=1912876 RepID=UPI0021BABD5A|nr:oligosaccharide flippase family protein [Arcobacter lacus]MCG3714145.1 oligosaccharide flippase family protein [Aliarcobacter butzleri]MCT7908125.1 oligosaccharide flippase family protein [Arcobacter lacus]
MTKKLFTNSFIYVLGDVLNKSIPFLMLPILTRYLTPEDYGIISVFTILVSILAVFTGLSIHGAININFFKMQKHNLKVFICNCLIILNISTLVVFILVYLLHPIILERLTLEIEWLFVAVVLAFAQFLTTINLLLWTAEQRPKPYSIYQISQTFTITSLSILMVVGFGMNWEGQLIATAIGTILFSAISLVFIVKRGYLIFKPNKEHIKDALKFGIPLIPHQLAGWIQTGADRIVLMSVLGATATGIYAVAYQIGMIISVIVTAFNKAWSPYMFKILSNNPTNESKKKIVIFTYVYFISIFVFTLVFFYIAKLLIPYYLGEKFLNSSEYIFYFALAFAFQGMYFMVTNYIFYVKKTYILAYLTFSTSILHISLLYLFINANGAIGAAQASLISFIVTFLATWILASKVYEMPWKVYKV